MSDEKTMGSRTSTTVVPLSHSKLGLHHINKIHIKQYEIPTKPTVQVPLATIGSPIMSGHGSRSYLTLSWDLNFNVI